MSEEFMNFCHEEMAKDEQTQAQASDDAPVAVENDTQEEELLFPDNLPEHPVKDAEELPEPPQEINLTIEETTPQGDNSAEQTNSPQETKNEPQEKKNDAPKLKTDPKGTYHGFFLAPINHLQRITNALTEMAKTDKELADAIALGKKTFEGCDRWIRNNMYDLARELGQREIVFKDKTVHFIARHYMVTTDNLDVQNVAQAIKAKEEPKPKEKKPKAETKKPKAEPKPKTIPLTPQMGDLFADFFDEDNNKED